jgi:hypothetical protein
VDSAHHTAEDETLRPVLAPLLVDRPTDLALPEAMEAEHAAIDAVLTVSTSRLDSHVQQRRPKRCN